MDDHPAVKWRRAPRFWDTFSIPSDVPRAHLFTWVAEHAPSPMEHDYILHTDGSGCVGGWGAHAALIQKVELSDTSQRRDVVDSRLRLAATYGSTVQRNELSAMLDGLHEILQWRTAEAQDEAVDDNDDAGKRDTLRTLTADNRVTVLWFTDRSNLAQALLFDEDDRPLNARSSEMDLWMRFSAMARFCCITPMLMPRNTVGGQAACDALCGVARQTIKEAMDSLTAAVGSFYSNEKWTQPKPQRALF